MVSALTAGLRPAGGNERDGVVRFAIPSVSETLSVLREGVRGFCVNPIFSLSPGVKPPMFKNRSAILSAIFCSLAVSGADRKQCHLAICSLSAFSICSTVGNG